MIDMRKSVLGNELIVTEHDKDRCVVIVISSCKISGVAGLLVGMQIIK